MHVCSSLSDDRFVHSPSSSIIITVVFGAGKLTARSVEARPTKNSSLGSASTSSTIMMSMQIRVVMGPNTKVSATIIGM